MSATNSSTPQSFQAEMAEKWVEFCKGLGYTYEDDDGNDTVDRGAIKEKVFGIVSKAKVHDKSERQDKSVTKADLASRVFPGVIGPSDKEYADDEAAQWLWSRCVQSAWSDTSPNQSSRVQKWVGERVPGFVMCQTIVGLPDNTSTQAVYITDDLDCILADFSVPLKDSVRKASEKLAKNLGMVTNRQPAFKDTFAKELESGMKSASTLAKGVLQLTTSGG